MVKMPTKNTEKLSTADKNDLARFVSQANKKPLSGNARRVSIYLPDYLEDEFNDITTKNGISKTVAFKAFLAAWLELDANEQNRHLFDALRRK